MAPGIGSIKAKALLDYFKSPENIFNASVNELSGVKGVNPAIAQGILNVSKDKSLLDKELRLIKKENVDVVTIFDEKYPVNLKEIHDPPVVLYVKGSFKKEDKQAVAIVGSRRCSSYGRNTAARFASGLAGLGITVVSGMARGIDTAAHSAAVNSRARTIAVLGSGLSRIYPPENKALSERIAEYGAVISEFPMTMRPLALNFPRRNRIISGLSLGTVVVEAAKNSGALITARCAYEQGREVFSVPGEALKPAAFGVNQLIKDGARLVEDVNDILEELAPQLKGYIKANRATGQVPLPLDLKSEELKIIGLLEDGPMHVDVIASGASFPIADTSSVLTGLEIRGLIRRNPGNIFERNFPCQSR
ncbi:MAG: DNA-protecting protein DprA [Candidatus Omnitrophica bacterium CG10_big_fil_rev_8_21_14_0_10_43_8]|nr:MAG: DNA-protecting protein DprA [Candidatus Omnitrophica bacterium CG10_big_fil_rev_8_21_14_0_10_43_8]